ARTTGSAASGGVGKAVNTGMPKQPAANTQGKTSPPHSKRGMMVTKQLRWSALLLSVLLTPSGAWAGREKLDAALLALADSRSARSNIIIQLAPPPGQASSSSNWLPGDTGLLNNVTARITAMGGTVSRSFHLIRGLAAVVPATGLDTLANDNRIARI